MFLMGNCRTANLLEVAGSLEHSPAAVRDDLCGLDLACNVQGNGTQKVLQRAPRRHHPAKTRSQIANAQKTHWNKIKRPK
jgi:hypothetical protein